MTILIIKFLYLKTIKINYYYHIVKKINTLKI